VTTLASYHCSCPRITIFKHNTLDKLSTKHNRIDSASEEERRYNEDKAVVDTYPSPITCHGRKCHGEQGGRRRDAGGLKKLCVCVCVVCVQGAMLGSKRVREFGLGRPM
jgi:hypothetical protein